MDSRPQVLSVMEDYLGHKTYGEMMRRFFHNSACDIDFYWYKDNRELSSKIINRLLSFYFPNKWVEKQNLDLHRWRIQAGFAHMTKRLVVRNIQQKQYDALHFHTQAIALTSIDLLNKFPTVVSLDFTAVQASQEKTDPQFRWTYQPNIWSEKRVFDAATKIITFSEYTRQSVIKDYNIAEDKVKTVYAGVDINAIKPGEQFAKKTDQLLQILLIGGDFKRKGGEDVLEVFLSKFADVAELHLVTGATVECSHPHVHIYKNILPYTAEWLKLYQQADVYVMPTYAEAFGHVFVEAMAAGLPIITTNINAIPEIVIPGETGFLIKPGDREALANKIQHLIDNPALGQQMGVKARQVVEQKFNAQKNFQTVESIFQEISV